MPDTKQLLFTLLLVLSASAMHLAMHEQQELKFQNGQSYSNVCIGGVNNNGHWGYISIHDNHQLYFVRSCLANQRWNLQYQKDGSYCIQSNKQRGRYVSADFRSRKTDARQAITSRCLSLEKWTLQVQGKDGFKIRSTPRRTQWNYFYKDRSTPNLADYGGSIFYLMK